MFQFQVQVCRRKKFSGAKESYKTYSTIKSLRKNFFLTSLNFRSIDILLLLNQFLRRFCKLWFRLKIICITFWAHKNTFFILYTLILAGNKRQIISLYFTKLHYVYGNRHINSCFHKNMVWPLQLDITFNSTKLLDDITKNQWKHFCHKIVTSTSLHLEVQSWIEFQGAAN